MEKYSRSVTTVEKKQAYLIMAHKNDTGFKTLLRMLDDPKNDIFVHMDLKNGDYDPEEIERSIKYSNITHVKRTKVTWGGYSQINAELLLLKASTAMGKYQHYHLLSGADLPIKSQDEIYHFFAKNDGKEFVQFQSDKFSFPERTQYYYPLMEITGRDSNPLYWKLSAGLLSFQKVLHVCRNKSIKFQKGTNWFSISDELARYVVSLESWIQKTFKNTSCCDEVFLQTIVVNSPFRKRLYYNKFDDNYCAIVRLIDWKRGNPYIFRKTDFHELMESKMLFARKFDSSVDSEIIEAIEKQFG